MVLKKRDIQPQITLETYTGYPSLKRVAIPLAANKDGDAVGIIQKIRKLDPRIAKNHVFIDPLVIDRMHSKEDPNGTTKKLFKPSSINDLKNFFQPIDDLVKDDVFLHATQDGNKSKFLKKSDNGLKVWQDVTLRNGGWMVKPQFLLRDLDGYTDVDGFPADKVFMKDVNMCKYRNAQGLVFNRSSLQDFARVTGVNLEENKDYYHGIHRVMKDSQRFSRPLLQTEKKYKIGESVKKSAKELLESLLYKQDSQNSEKDRLKTLSQITGLSESEAKNRYTLKKNAKLVEANRTAERLAKRVKLNFENQSVQKRDDACKLVTVLNNLQERKGWHNRITPMDSVDTPKKAYKALSGEKDSTIQNDLKKASESLKNTANLLKICEDPNDPTSCLHPTEKEHLGLYGRNKGGNVFKQTSWMEPSEEMRAYALIDVPLIFYQRSGDNSGRIELLRKLRKGIKESGQEKRDPLDEIHSFDNLQRFGKIVDTPLVDPNESKINFAPDVSLRSERLQKSNEIKEKIDEYYSGMEPFVVTNELRSFRPVKDSEIRRQKLFPDSTDESERNLTLFDSPIDESMVYPHQLLTYPIKEDGSEEHTGCLAAQFREGDRSVSITSGDLVLLDGMNTLIRWKNPDGTRKTIRDVYDEIIANGGSRSRASPSKWKWSCIADTDLDPSFAENLPNEKKFKFKKFTSRRAVDLHYRKEGEDNVTLAVDKDSIANALKDIAIDASNAITLGAMTQMDGYIQGNQDLLFNKKFDWNDIRKGGSPQRRRKVNELKQRIDQIQESLQTTDQFNVIKDLVSNERNTSINATPMWFDPQAKVLIQRRKDIKKKNYGLPKSLYISPIKNSVNGRRRSENKAILALETNLMDVFKSLDVTPKK